ncbi:hypothetical protein TSOC_010174 [Tetrabaena socialis]|uniref:phytol kinase n=1 Tax=Tetrabaena socialis TaxID=47790 RepID=A0A2J7ZU05_9CHLO|nr:hypothetical protein TSOC_010174 [Tetrabaena socialis]|eukprot:PNH03742.1 hypothetical protein TSOC_010174 [Tetrabaena socialis]
MLGTIRDYLATRDGAVDAQGAVLGDTAVRLALLRLVAAAVRWSVTGSGDAGHGALHRASMHVATGLFQYNFQFAASPAVADFVRKLLRMHTLQCLSKQFAAAATAVGVLTAPQLEYLASAAFLFCYLVASELDGVVIEVEDGDKAGRLLELARALRDSSVLEHASRLLLLREDALPSGLVTAPPPDLCAMPSGVLSTYYSFTVMQQMAEERLAGAAEAEAARAALREVQCGPCARHAALVHGVAMLCRADGGPSYGLPAHLLSAALPRTRTDSLVPGALVVQDRTARALMAVCQGGMAPTRLGRRIAVLLLLRLARMAVASVRVWASARGAHGSGAAARPADAPAATGRQPPLQPPQPLQQQQHPAGAARPEVGAADALGLSPLLLLPLGDTSKLMLESMSVTWRLLAEALALQPDGWAAAAGAEMWRLVAAETRRGLQWGIKDEDMRWLGSALSWRLGAVLADGEPLPPAPPPVFAVALAGGVLPCVERLLRRAGEAPLCPEARLAEGLLYHATSGPLLVALLAYGEPRQAAALVATLGKLLRGFSSACPALAVAPTGVMDLVVACVRCVLLEVLYGSEERLSSRWVGAGQQQLARMISYAVCEWLPPLSRLARQWMAAGAAPNSDDTWRCLGLPALICWLPPLACRALGGGSGAVGAADEAAAGAAGAAMTAAGVAGGWRKFVLKEVAAVPLLGDALRWAQREDVDNEFGFWDELALACCGVAAACPEEVLGAGRESAAAAARAPCAGVLPCGILGRGVPVSGGKPAVAMSSPPAAPGGGGNEAGEALEALAAQLEAWEAGGGDSCNARGKKSKKRRQRVLAAWGRLEAESPEMTAIAAVLLPPAEARALLRTCSYPACANLAGDSEADLRLQSCGKCAAAAYCCRACQVAHWRAGHREACALLAPGPAEG